MSWAGWLCTSRQERSVEDHRLQVQRKKMKPGGKQTPVREGFRATC